MAEDACPSTRTASCYQVLEIVSPLAGRNGDLLRGPTLFMLLQMPKTVKEVWHYSASRSRLTAGHSVNCTLELEFYTDGSMAWKGTK